VSVGPVDGAFQGQPAFENARALVPPSGNPGRTSGHVRYYEPTPIQRFPVSCSVRCHSNYQRYHPGFRPPWKPIRSGSTTSIRSQAGFYRLPQSHSPGWADTIKPDFTGFHHRASYEMPTGGLHPQAAFGIYVLRDTTYAVNRQSIENLRNLILTYRLYCQKYAMPRYSRSHAAVDGIISRRRCSRAS